MMHTLRFEQCIGPDMTPCLCERCPVYGIGCPFLVRIEITYYDNALIRVTMNNIILDSMDPEKLRDKMNAGFKNARDAGAINGVRVFSPKGHAE